jgi:pimeloyl-ACP methyl ester carboxylesterase
VYDTTIHASDLHTILHALGVTNAVHFGHSFGGPISLQYYFDYPDEVAGIVFLGSYSAGSQLTITEEQVLQFYDTIAGRQMVFQTFITHPKFVKYNPYGADIEALLQREACKPPIYASKATCRASSVSILTRGYRPCRCQLWWFMVTLIDLFLWGLQVECWRAGLRMHA